MCGRGSPISLLGLPPPALADCKRVALAGSFLTIRTLGVIGAISYSSVAAATLGATVGAAHQVCLPLMSPDESLMSPDEHLMNEHLQNA